ncbi:MAG: metalloregulator ArsR/SmtB family transcription factor [Gemmatimonadota bacterium]
MTPRACPPTPTVDPLSDPDEELARLAAALGHPARVRILRFLLEQRECFAGAIVDHLPLAQSTVSQHLKVLREAGLIRGKVDGLHICYCADEVRLARVRELAEAMLPTTVGGHS